MSWFPFFTSVTARVSDFCGNLFRRHVSPSEIDSMPYSQLRYWNEWVKAIDKSSPSIGL